MPRRPTKKVSSDRKPRVQDAPLNVQEVAETLGKAPAEAYRLLSGGEIKGAYKDGREWRVLQSDLQAHIYRQRDEYLAAAKSGAKAGVELKVA